VACRCGCVDLLCLVVCRGVDVALGSVSCAAVMRCDVGRSVPDTPCRSTRARSGQNPATAHTYTHTTENPKKTTRQAREKEAKKRVQHTSPIKTNTFRSRRYQGRERADTPAPPAMPPLRYLAANPPGMRPPLALTRPCHAMPCRAVLRFPAGPLIRLIRLSARCAAV
jgi:hypothetical protein